MADKNGDFDEGTYQVLAWTGFLGGLVSLAIVKAFDMIKVRVTSNKEGV